MWLKPHNLNLSNFPEWKKVCQDTNWYERHINTCAISGCLWQGTISAQINQEIANQIKLKYAFRLHSNPHLKRKEVFLYQGLVGKGNFQMQGNIWKVINSNIRNILYYYSTLKYSGTVFSIKSIVLTELYCDPSLKEHLAFIRTITLQELCKPPCYMWPVLFGGGVIKEIVTPFQSQIMSTTSRLPGVNWSTGKAQGANQLKTFQYKMIHS